MASNCPLCNTPVTEDFGLIECTNCGAQLLVHMDGRVVYSGADDKPPVVPEEAAAPGDRTRVVGGMDPTTHFAFAIDEAQEVSYKSALAPDPEPVLVADLEPTVVRKPNGGHDVPPPVPEATDEDEFSIGSTVDEDDLDRTTALEPMPAEPEPEPEPEYEPEPEPEPEPAEVSFLDEEELPAAPEELAPTTPPEDISDIARFGNSDASSTRDGSLRYNLHISGIDTADVRENFREAITDRKLIWDTDQILRSIRGGEVRITAVSPAKAYIVISRLRELPVKVVWEQYATSQT